MKIKKKISLYIRFGETFVFNYFYNRNISPQKSYICSHSAHTKKNDEYKRIHNETTIAPQNTCVYLLPSAPNNTADTTGGGCGGCGASNGTNGLAAGSSMAFCVKSSSVKLVTAAESSGFTAPPAGDGLDGGAAAAAADDRSSDDDVSPAILSDMMMMCGVVVCFVCVCLL